MRSRWFSTFLSSSAQLRSGAGVGVDSEFTTKLMLCLVFAFHNLQVILLVDPPRGGNGVAVGGEKVIIIITLGIFTAW